MFKLLLIQLYNIIMRIFKTTLLALGTFVVLAFASCERDHVKMDTDQELN
ncbi:MAG: hypothetical protein ACI8ZO_001481, partial [Flavobacteriales bacterium]